MSTIRDILATKESTEIHAVDLRASVFDAVRKMCAHRVGALLVELDSIPLGIVSERDIMTRVLLAGLDPAATPAASVMTQDLVCVTPGWDVGNALALMTERRVRHLPVTERSVLIGIVSMGDLVRCAGESRDYENRVLKDYVAGVYS